MKDPYDIILITALGLDNESKFNFINTPGVKHEWLEDGYTPDNDAVNTSTLTSVSTLTVITVDNGAYFQPGDVILIDAEYMWVSEVSSNVLNVTRDYGGTQATHADDSVVYRVARNRLEGDAPDASHWTEVLSGYNYSAIFQKTIEVSRSDNLINRYGIDNVVSREIDKAMDELMLNLCRAGYHGQRKVGTASTPRGFGGMLELITSNATAKSSAALTRSDIETIISSSWSFGGNPDLMFVGSWAKRKIASFFEGFVRTERSESMGGIEIDRIVTPLGIDVAVVQDRQLVPGTDILVIDSSLVGYLTIDPFFWDELGKTKDTAAYGQVVGEYGFVLADERKHGKITGISVTS
jgi:hypothetical protein